MDFTTSAELIQLFDLLGVFGLMAFEIRLSDRQFLFIPRTDDGALWNALDTLKNLFHDTLNDAVELLLHINRLTVAHGSFPCLAVADITDARLLDKGSVLLRVILAGGGEVEP